MNVDVKFLENLIDCVESCPNGGGCLIEPKVKQLKRLVEVEKLKEKQTYIRKGLEPPKRRP